LRPADGEYEELPEAPPEEEEEAAAAEGGAAEGEGARRAAQQRARHVSVPASLSHAPPLPPPSSDACRPELQARARAHTRGRVCAHARPRAHTHARSLVQAHSPKRRARALSLPSPLLQAKLARFHALMLAGRSINAELRKSKGYRNPDFLQKIVEHFGIVEHGSGYPAAVFDPAGLNAEDFYDALGEPAVRQRARAGVRARVVVFCASDVRYPRVCVHLRAPQLRRSASRRRRARWSAPAAPRWISRREGRTRARARTQQWPQWP
jgi:hypothetical protein